MSFTPPPVARTIKAMRAQVEAWHAAGETVALVPTMGALHDGHLALVREAAKRGGRVVVSIFVNPTQFAPNEDFSRYPRNEKADLAKLVPLGVDLVYAPKGSEMYGANFCTTVSLSGPATAGLEDKYRPHFFSGVATVVAKLFTQVRPDIAVFGQKDYQQLLVITQMARDLDLAVKVVGARTVREKDGLALSSRNAYLSQEERLLAPHLNVALRDCARRLAEGGDVKRVMKAAHQGLERQGFRVDYVEARNAQTLAALKNPAAAPVRLLVAAWLGTTRLIDNIAG